MSTRAFARAARKIVVDIDSNELEKPTLNPDLPIAMDAGEFIRECLSLLPTSHASTDAQAYASWIERCREWRLNFPPDSYSGPSLPQDSQNGDKPGNELIYPLSILRSLSNEMGDDDVVVADGANALVLRPLDQHRFTALHSAGGS